MKKTFALILVVCAFIAGYRIGIVRGSASQQIPHSVVALATASPTATATAKPAASLSYSFSSILSSIESAASSTSQNPQLHDYVGNKKTKKFHKPSCSSVDQMKESNKKYFDSVTRQSVIDAGYTPCGRCNP